MPTFVLPDKCDGCQECLEACGLAAIRIEDGVAVIDPEVCRDCEACLEACPREAIVQT
ncbi:MAG: 4Fe-4S binding protein [Proteobacteria bacterium]|nr:4Fe-4S binding protein [Pseudomonadota bacterium]MBU1740839.1 4Fe-4S binding protein [Pseudomonadota bacterium]